MENGMEVSQKIKYNTPICIMISLWNTYTKEMKSIFVKNNWTPMFIAALLTIAMI
jgi:hypothetical protein